MPSIARIGDSTTGTCSVGLICCPHSRSGTVTDTSEDVFVNGVGVFRVGDSGSCNCPHGGTFKGVSGSTQVFANGKQVARIGDSTSCVSCGLAGTVTSGSPNVFANG